MERDFLGALIQWNSYKQFLAYCEITEIIPMIAKMLGTSEIVMWPLSTQFSPSIQAHFSTWAMNETKILDCLGYLGDNTAQLCGDFLINHYNPKDPMQLVYI